MVPPAPQSIVIENVLPGATPGPVASLVITTLPSVAMRVLVTVTVALAPGGTWKVQGAPPVPFESGKVQLTVVPPAPPVNVIATVALPKSKPARSLGYVSVTVQVVSGWC
jgi:hypothetical protein